MVVKGSQKCNQSCPDFKWGPEERNCGNSKYCISFLKKVVEIGQGCNGCCDQPICRDFTGWGDDCLKWTGQIERYLDDDE